MQYFNKNLALWGRICTNLIEIANTPFRILISRLGKKAATIPQAEIEERYASLFLSETGMPAKPLRTALGSLRIKKQYGYSDRELAGRIRENPYYQYFIGLSGYQDKILFVPSLLVEFYKRPTDEALIEINEMIAEYNSPQNPPTGGGNDDPDDGDSATDNRGTLILDATCAPY